MKTKITNVKTFLWIMLMNLLFITIGFGQVTNKISYQAVIRDASNELVRDSQIGVRISILQGVFDGPEIYTETLTPETNANGLVIIEFGDQLAIDDINQASGPFFIKTEIDPTGGSNYTITGVSQIYTVPFAVHSKTAEKLTGEITETDPVFLESIDVSNAAAGDILKYDGNKFVPSVITSSSGGISVMTSSEILEINPEQGQMIFNKTENLLLLYVGDNWLTILQNIWVPGIETQIVEVLNPTTGKTWMDRNLGASRAATSRTDAEAYGDLYQWGRAADGHQVRSSGTTTTLSNSDTPGHGNFILNPNSPYDWRSPQNTDLWQGVNGSNNPCPAGYRLPTEVEWNAERLSWSSKNAAGDFDSPLKLPLAGGRSYHNGSFFDVGSHGYYWSGTEDGTYSRYLLFYRNELESDARMSSETRGLGGSIRCLKE